MKLPLNCSVDYYEQFLTPEFSEELFQYLCQLQDLVSPFCIETQTGEKFNFDYGKCMFIEKNKQENFKTSHWGINLEYPPILLMLKNKIEDLLQDSFDICVAIYYPNGKSGVDYHSDLEAFGDTTTIPSISLGQERVFSLRENSSQEEFKVTLTGGSLIVMGEGCQQKYEHSLLIDTTIQRPRINLTFRKHTETS